MQVVFIHGPAASGKYTIAKQLSQLTSLPLFHNHLAVDAAASLFGFGSPGFCRLRASIWREAFAAAAEERQSFIFTFHPEASVDRALIDELTSGIEERGGDVLFIELTCSREAILARLNNDSRRQFGKLTDTGLFQQIEAEGGFDFPALPRPELRINTEKVEPVVAAKHIADAVYARRRR